MQAKAGRFFSHPTNSFTSLLLLILLCGGLLACARLENGSPPPVDLTADSPENASYLIEDEQVQLQSGRAQWQAVPGSASMVKITILGEPLHADLNNDRHEDAVLFLTFQGGGTGTFSYLGAAIRENGNYRGTNAILLGDRIGPPTAKVQNGLISVEYLDRSPEEPMVSEPSVLQTKFFILNDTGLQEIKPAEDEEVYQGWLTIGHEVRSFLPCDENKDLWLLGKSPALAVILAVHRETMSGLPPYTPVFVILTGRKTAPFAEGFGTADKQAFFASQLVMLWPHGNCRSDSILLDSPLPGAHISSPLTVKGRARGTWFFEGDFPLMLRDAQGKNIAAGYATAKGEWMTENFVEFEGTIDFKDTFSNQRGTLVLEKDNPTGLTRYDDALQIPIHFK